MTRSLNENFAISRTTKNLSPLESLGQVAWFPFFVGGYVVVWPPRGRLISSLFLLHFISPLHESTILIWSHRKIIVGCVSCIFNGGSSSRNEECKTEKEKEKERYGIVRVVHLHIDFYNSVRPAISFPYFLCLLYLSLFIALLRTPRHSPGTSGTRKLFSLFLASWPTLVPFCTLERLLATHQPCRQH